jgi:ribose transport system ATP-binding protein
VGGADADSRPDEPVLRVRGVVKSFPGVRALDGVDLDLRAGEVLAVVGENGAGKSTLMKILAGVERADAGTMRLHDRLLAPRSVHDAIEAGVALMHQELNLAGNLDITSNICLGREPRRWGLIDRAAARATARRALDAVGLDEPPERRVDELTIGHRQLVEIAKALSIDARILIMDEPTSSLSASETERLFGVVRQLRARGVGVIYISHRLAEVEAIADRVVVLRDGRVSGRLEPDELGPGMRETIVRHMIGRDLAGSVRARSIAPGAVRLAVRGLRTRRHPAAVVDLDVRAGEMVGLAGLVGAGRTELLAAIFGADPPLAGTVSVDGRATAIRAPAHAIARGLGLVPEDRQLHGLFVEESVRRNLGLTELARHARAGFVDRARERTTSARLIERLRIRATSDHQVTGTLSGGNQQKVVLGKWLALEPGVLVLDEPTRGVDVGARAEIYALMERMVADGVAILFASSDLEEIIALSDRVLVMRDGAVTGELPRDGLDEEAIMRLATSSDETEDAA